MPDHEWDSRPLLLGERQELRSQARASVAVERDEVRDPEAVKDGEQQQRVFGRLSEASACSISRRARSTAALVSGAA